MSSLWDSMSCSRLGPGLTSRAMYCEITPGLTSRAMYCEINAGTNVPDYVL